jgi:hypothetical protein
MNNNYSIKYEKFWRAVMANISVDKESIKNFCSRWSISELAFFGSVLREDFQAGSDIDVLVQFGPKSEHTLFDLVRMQEELSGILGRKVDLVSRSGIESSRNYFRKNEILSSAKVIYGA